MAKRNLGMKKVRRAEREQRKAQAASDRAEFRRQTNSCPMCGSALESYEITVVDSGKKVAMDMCPRCYEGAA